MKLCKIKNCKKSDKNYKVLKRTKDIKNEFNLNK